LVPLLVQAGHDVRCMARGSDRLQGRFDDRVEVVEGDVVNRADIDAAVAGCDMAYYLIHSMSSTTEFAQADHVAARAFGEASKAANLKRIIYVGGLGDDNDSLSVHLRSRHEVGDVLRAGGVPVIEFRAAQIIGSGSISFEMMRYLTERLPVMIAPKWVMTRCQPLAVRDMLDYLIAATDLQASESRIYEVGGADVLTYREMMLAYASIRGLARKIIVVPFFTPRLSSYWVHLITPISSRLAQPLISGLHNEVIVRDDSARTDFPQIRPRGFAEAVRSALDRYDTGPETAWFDAFDLKRGSRDFTGTKEGMLMDVRVRKTSASAADVARVFTSLGGRRGWLAANALWQIRGWLDLAFGGVGVRRGRRSPTDLRLGDAVDFWRVEAYQREHLLRLRAEMKLPGRAWLQFEVEPGDDGSTFRQTAYFEPRGLFGYLYWYSVAVFHQWVFSGMATRIVREAERRETLAPAS
ncbi:MAG: SDR family oxidoreductase, partial [Candidatus Eremiobacteraeota bacterium]|nr:SDR family oxidoreductase [Candidatus Eremiobacteraeota bacterium]